MSRARENPSLPRALCLLTATMLLAGCPRNIEFGPGGRIDDPGALLQKVDATEAPITGLVADGRLGIDAPQGKGEVAVFISVERPNKLHVETFDFFNRPMAVLVCDGEKFGLYDGSEGRYYFGPATAQNLRRLLQAELSPEQVVALMLGSAPRDLNAEVSLSLDDKLGAYLLVLQSPTQPQRLWIDPIRLRPIRSEWAGASPLVAQFGDFIETTSAPFPKQITVEAPRAKLTLKLRYTELTFNKSEEGMFDVQAPDGVPQVELDAEGFPVSGASRSDPAPVPEEAAAPEAIPSPQP